MWSQSTTLNESWPSPTCSPVNPVDHFRWKELFTRFTLVISTVLITSVERNCLTVQFGWFNRVDNFRWKELFTRFTLVDSTVLITSDERNCLHDSLWLIQPCWSLPLKGTVYTVHFGWFNRVDHLRWKELFTRFTLVDSNVVINLGDPCKRALLTMSIIFLLLF